MLASCHCTQGNYATRDSDGNMVGLCAVPLDAIMAFGRVEIRG